MADEVARLQQRIDYGPDLHADLNGEKVQILVVRVDFRDPECPVLVVHPAGQPFKLTAGRVLHGRNDKIWSAILEVAGVERNPIFATKKKEAPSDQPV